VPRSVTPAELSSGERNMELCEQNPEFLQGGPEQDLPPDVVSVVIKV